MASSANDANLFRTLAAFVNVIIACFLAYLARESLLSLFLSKTNRTHWTAAVHSGNTHGRGHHGPSLDAGVGIRSSWMPSGDYRGLGGCGFGTPVVSYAPRPIVKALIVEDG